MSANRWIVHVKEFASKHNMTYGEALKNTTCKATYRYYNQFLIKGAGDRDDENQKMFQEDHLGRKASKVHRYPLARPLSYEEMFQMDRRGIAPHAQLERPIPRSITTARPLIKRIVAVVRFDDGTIDLVESDNRRDRELTDLEIMELLQDHELREIILDADQIDELRNILGERRRRSNNL